MRRNSDDIYDRFRKHSHRTFEEAAARYLAEFQGKVKSRAAQSIDALRPYIGALRLIDVDDEALQQFKEDRKLGCGAFTKPAMAGTICKDLTQCTTILNKAAKVWRWIPLAPKIEHVKGPRKRAYPFTWEEQDRLFSALPTGWDCGAALFAVNTGVRKEELFGLKWTDRRWVPELDIKNADGSVKERMYVFVLAMTKNGMQRAVICNSIARRAVDYQRKWQDKHGESEFVFPSRSAARKFSKVRDSGTVWRRAWKEAGLPTGPFIKQGLHNARHTTGHRLRAVGCPREDRSAFLGHSKTSLEEHYAENDLARLLEWGEKITVRRETTILRAVG
jgi:integrase